MHVYIGVDCKECQKFIVFREIARGTEIDQAIGDHQLKCASGHRNTYSLGDFYTLESSTSYAPSLPNPRRGPGAPGSGKELLVIALLLALPLILLLVWWYH